MSQTRFYLDRNWLSGSAHVGRLELVAIAGEDAHVTPRGKRSDVSCENTPRGAARVTPPQTHQQDYERDCSGWDRDRSVLRHPLLGARHPSLRYCCRREPRDCGPVGHDPFILPLAGPIRRRVVSWGIHSGNAELHVIAWTRIGVPFVFY